MLIRGLHSSAYNAATTNATMRDLEMLLMRCDDAYKQQNAYYEMRRCL